MAFTNKYKSLGEVILAYRLQYRKEKFNITIKKNTPRKWLKEFRFDLANIPFDTSETMIHEVIIFPILRLAWKPIAIILHCGGVKQLRQMKN